MPSEDDRRDTRKAIKADIAGDEEILFHVTAYATAVWNERIEPGRPDMTGEWELTYRDGSRESIDLPQQNHQAVINEATGRIAKKLYGGY